MASCKLGILILCVVLGYGSSFAFASDPVEFEHWLEFQKVRSKRGLFENITDQGAVMASPSQFNPDYYFHWIRDAALVMKGVLAFARETDLPEEQNFYLKKLARYAAFSRENQLVPNRSGGLGEPKFYLDGSPYSGDWGRPQNDGPALRAVTLMEYALQSPPEIQSVLYDGVLPTHSVIKSDLEFISHHWRESSFDLWEEVKGQHFYTRMVQRKALLLGAHFADHMKDPGAALWYRLQAKELEDVIRNHWDAGRGYLVATLDQDGGFPGKTSGLDVAVLLAVLHAGDTQFYDVTHEQVLATATRLRDVFQRLFPINRNFSLAPAIGRYPEDIYTGAENIGGTGNPWFLATLAYAEFYFEAVQVWKEKKTIEVTQLNQNFFLPLRFYPGQTIVSGDPSYPLILRQLCREGDRFLERVRFHAPRDGSLSEQFNRDTGFMQGARDLTWSYDSFLSALRARSACQPERGALMGRRHAQLHP